MYTLARRLLRAVLLVLLPWTVLAQVLVYLIASQQGRLYPEVAHLVVPYSAAGILAIACVQVALIAVWQLLSLVGGNALFSCRAIRRLDAIAVCAAAATGLSAGPLIHLLFVVGVGGPLVVWLPAPLVGGVAVVLVMIVLRGVVESAIVAGSEPGAAG